MSAPVSAGDVLAGKYLVERVLGQGGMGVVVAAKHLQLDERVAIKFLLPEALKQPGLVARFLREGRLAAKIRSDHVARVRDVGTLESGAPYLVLEYLDGIDLNDLVTSRGPLRVEAAVEYILQACEALAEAHSLGIVHRDLKPANLFLTTRPDGSSCVKLIDFGISKISGGAELALTTTAEMRGSPLFMSPEQMMASPDLDARCDIWALGVTLYNLLTGAAPFPATTIPELCAKILQSGPVPLRALRPEAPEALEMTIFRCLQKAPEQRYSSVAQLASALAPFAPPLARVSVDRISRILGISALTGGAPFESASAAAPHENAGGGTTVGAASWSKTGARSSVSKRSLVAFALGVLVILSVGGAALLLRRAPAEATQASDKPAAALELEARPSATPIEIQAAPSASVVAAPPASSSGSAPSTKTAGPIVAAPVSVGAPSIASAAPSVRASGAALPPVKAKPQAGRDLFDTSL